MAVYKVGFDSGNFDVKIVSDSNQWHFRHIYATMPESVASASLRDGKLTDGVVSVNDNWYVLGDPAKRRQTNTQYGISRYVKNYYDVFMASALSLVLPQQKRGLKVHLSATLAPKDYKIGAKHLINCALGDYQVITAGGVWSFEVVQVDVIDEPLGGYGNLLFTKEGKTAKKADQHLNKDILIVDIGGKTSDFAPIDRGGIVDYSAIASEQTGIFDVMSAIENELKSSYPDKFFESGNHNLSLSKLEQIVQSKTWQYGRHNIDVASIVESNLYVLVNQIVERVLYYGGADEFQSIGLTGGGSAILYPYLQNALPMLEFILLEKAENMRYANASGALKIAKAQELAQ